MLEGYCNPPGETGGRLRVGRWEEVDERSWQIWNIMGHQFIRQQQAKNFSPQGQCYAHFRDPRSPTKGGTRALAGKMPSPNHRATREFPMLKTLSAALCMVPVP